MHTLFLSLFLAPHFVTAREAGLLNHAKSTPMSKFRSIQKEANFDTCTSMPKQSLRLPHGVFSHVPKFNTLDRTIIFPNRTAVLQLHNMALNRAFFFSFVWQNFNESRNDAIHLPGLFYLYLSAVADVTGNPNSVNASTLLYDVHKFYPNWFTSLPFNRTINLFGVRAVRFDSTFHPLNFLREPSTNMVMVYDLGAQNGENYTIPGYRNAPWYGSGKDDPRYVPEQEDTQNVGNKIHLFSFKFRIRDGVDISKNFFGPPYPGQLENELPVRFTQPWFDCGPRDVAFNEWMLSSVSPVIDVMPRYALVKNKMKPATVAVAAMDTFFINIPINLCPISLGNPSPNLIAGSDLCKKPSTVCQPIYRKNRVNFVSSPYECRCAAGFRYPILRETPWKGGEIRRSTKEEYQRSFQCLPIGNKMLWPTEKGLSYQGGERGGVKLARKRRSSDEVKDEEIKRLDAAVKAEAFKEEAERVNLTDRHPTRTEFVEAVLREHYQNKQGPVMATPEIQEEVHRLVSTFSKPVPSKTVSKKPKLEARYRRATNVMPEVIFNSAQHRAMDKVFAKKLRVSARNCHLLPPSDLLLPGNAGFGASTQFEGEAATALRLAHFLSAFLQLNQAGYVIANIRLGQKLHEDHVLGEAMANVAGSTRIISSGVFFARNKFVDSEGIRRKFYGPLVYRPGKLVAASFLATDLANFGGYTNYSWFSELQERWATNPSNLEKFLVLPSIREDPSSDRSIPHPDYPMKFWAPRKEDGLWTAPYFDCRSPVKEWILTYAVPFFGRSAEDDKLQFYGVVTTSVSLNLLNINQCPGKFYEANFFKNTALCDPETTYCRKTHIHGFQRGGYECHCRRGYEFPFEGHRFYYLGANMETEYKQMKMNEKNIFSLLKCREAGAHQAFLAPLLLLLQAIVIIVNELQ